MLVTSLAAVPIGLKLKFKAKNLTEWASQPPFSAILRSLLLHISFSSATHKLFGTWF